MVLDVLGLLSACSYALDCVEAELVHVSDKHAKRVAYMSVCMAEQLGISGESLQDLAACALLHDNDHFVGILFCVYECECAAGGRSAVRTEKFFSESGSCIFCGNYSYQKSYST